MSDSNDLAEKIDDAADPALARSQAEAARSQLTGTLVEIQARLKPNALAREAMGELKGTAQKLALSGAQGLKRHPLAVTGGVAALGLFLARGPLLRLFNAYRDETPPPSKSLKPKRASARRKGPST